MLQCFFLKTVVRLVEEQQRIEFVKRLAGRSDMSNLVEKRINVTANFSVRPFSVSDQPAQSKGPALGILMIGLQAGGKALSSQTPTGRALEMI